MPRAVRRNLAGTREQFEAVRDRYPEARMIIGADVYWDRSGTLFLVVPEAWADYLHGRRCEMPDDDVLDGGQTFEFDEGAFQNLMMEGGKS